MANTKNITNAIALEIAVAVAHGGDVATECDAHGFTRDQFAEKLEKMLATARKPRNKGERGETPEQRKNREEYIPAMLAAMRAHGEPVTCKWITEHVAGVTTTQKATGLLGICIKAGTVDRIQVGRSVTFMAL